MSKYKFDVSLVISGLSEGVFELQPSDYLYCEDEDELFDEVNDTLWYTSQAYQVLQSIHLRIRLALPKRIFGRMEAIKE